MVTTRAESGKRNGASGRDDDDKQQQPVAGDKHQTEHEAPEPKRTKVDEKQTTLDDQLVKLKDDGKKEDDEETKKGEPKNEGHEDVKQGGDPKNGTKANSESAIKPSEELDIPSSILEKGIIYFFIRGRVGIDTPSQVDDIARTYMLLRPIQKDAKLGQGPLGDAGNTRLIALPKKVLPVSGKDRFMMFVEKSGASYEELKKEFLSATDYETKTSGTRHSPAATPIGEGVYAMTTTGRESHLVYMTTLPEKLGEVQKELGLKDKGSFIISTKNPQYPGPANAQLPKGPEYSKDQILLIGESSGIENAVQPQKKDQKEGKEDPEEALEHLEEEDLDRMKHLGEDHSASIFTDLEAHAKDYPKLQTAF